LPFDGTVNFREVARALKRVGYTGTVTLEVSQRAKDSVPFYGNVTMEEMLQEAHTCAERIALLVEAVDP
jgi:sugar phosphate isomerase/epimerase